MAESRRRTLDKLLPQGVRNKAMETDHHSAYHIINMKRIFFQKNSYFLIISFRHDAQGNSAISYIVRATSHLLDPRASEFSASFVGRLVTTLIKKVSETIIYLGT